MKNNVFVLDSFKREFKRLYKKYKSLYSDVANLIAALERDANQGVLIGGNVRKIRLSIASKGKGDSETAESVFDNIRNIYFPLFDEFEKTLAKCLE